MGKVGGIAGRRWWEGVREGGGGEREGGSG